MRFLSDCGTEVLDWPGNSTDINPIEEIRISNGKLPCPLCQQLLSSSTGYTTQHTGEEYVCTLPPNTDSITNCLQLIFQAKSNMIQYYK